MKVRRSKKYGLPRETAKKDISDAIALEDSLFCKVNAIFYLAGVLLSLIASNQAT